MSDVIGRAVIEIVPDFSKFTAQVQAAGQKASRELASGMAKANPGKGISDSVTKNVNDATKQIGKIPKAAQDAANRVNSSAKQTGHGFTTAAGEAQHSWLGAAKKIGVALGAAFLVHKATDFVKESVKDFENMGVEVLKTTRLTGASAEDASRLGFVFKYMGLNSGQATKSLIFLSKNMNKAKTVSEKAAAKLEKQNKKYTEQADALRALPKLTDKQRQKLQDLNAMIADTGFQLKSPMAAVNDIGVTVTKADGELRPIKDVLIDTAEAFKKMDGGAQKNALALKIFGRSGADLLPVLNKGRAGIDELMKKSDEFGLTMTQEGVDSVKEYRMAQKDLKFSFEGLKHALGEILIPVMTKFIKIMTTYLVPAIKIVRQWIKTSLEPAIHSLWKTFEPLITAVFKGVKQFYDFLASLKVLRPVIMTLIGALVAYKAITLAMAAADKFRAVQANVARAAETGKSIATRLGLVTSEAAAVASGELAASEGVQAAAAEAATAAAGELAASEGLQAAAAEVASVAADELAASEGMQAAAAEVASVATEELAGSEGLQVAAAEAAAIATEELATSEGLQSAAAEAAAVVTEELAASEGLQASAAQAAAAVTEELAGAEGLQAAAAEASVAATEGLAASQGLSAAAMEASAGASVAASAALEGTAVATEGAAVATEGFGAALLANPIGLVVAAIVALGAAFVVAYMKIKPFRDLVDKIGRSLRDGLLGVWDKIKQGVEVVVNAFKKGGDAIKGTGLVGFLERIGNIARTVFDIFKGDISIGDGFAKLKDKLVGLVQSIPSAVADAFSKIGDVFGNLSGLADKAEGFVDKLFMGLLKATLNIPIIGPIVGWLKSAFDAIFQQASGFFKIFEGIFKWDPAKIKEGIGKVFESIKTYFFGALKGLGGILGGAGDIVAKVGPIIGNALAGAGKFVAQNLPKVFDFLKNLPSILFKLIGNLGGKLFGLIGGIFSGSKGGGEKKKAGVDFGKVLKDIFVRGFGGILKGLGPLLGGLGSALWSLLKVALNIVFVKIPGLLLSWLGQIGKVLLKLFSLAFNFLKDHFGEIVKGLAFLFIGLPIKILGWLGPIGLKLLGWLAKGFGFLVTNSAKIVVGLISWLVSLPGKMIGWLGDIGKLLFGWLKKGWDWLVVNGPKILTAVGNWLLSIPGKFLALLGNIGTKLVEWMKAGWNWIVVNAVPILAAVGNWLISLPGKILGWLGDLGSKLLGWMKAAWNFIVTNGPVILSTLLRWVTSIPRLILRGLGTVGSKIFDWLKSGFDYVKNNGPRLISGVVDFFKSIPGRIFTALGNAISGGVRIAGKVFDFGKKLWGSIKGFINDRIIFPIADVSILGKKPFGFLRNLALANGDVVTGPVNALIGEAGPEVVIPLTRPRRAAELVQKSGLMGVLAQTGEGQRMMGMRAFANGGIVDDGPLDGGERLPRRRRRPARPRLPRPPTGYVTDAFGNLSPRGGWMRDINGQLVPNLRPVRGRGAPSWWERLTRRVGQMYRGRVNRRRFADGGIVYDGPLDGGEQTRRPTRRRRPPVRLPRPPTGYVTDAFGNFTPRGGWVRDVNGELIPNLRPVRGRRAPSFWSRIARRIAQAYRGRPNRRRFANGGIVDVGPMDGGEQTNRRRTPRPSVRLPRPPTGYVTDAFGNFTPRGGWIRDVNGDLVPNLRPLRGRGRPSFWSRVARRVARWYRGRPNRRRFADGGLVGPMAAFADGAFVNTPTFAMIGEAGPEVVLPLTQPRRAWELASKSGLLSVLSQGSTLPAGRPTATTAAPVAAGAVDGGFLGGGPGNTYVIHGISLDQVKAEIRARDEAVMRVRR